jgi:hypothetical protein
MKVIFLDHDGVVCLSNNWGGRTKKKGYDSNPETPLSIRMDNFDAKAVKVLNKILEETDAEIVISSDWKLHGTLEQMIEMYKDYGVIKTPIAYTPNMKDYDPEAYALYQWRGWSEQQRSEEIKRYLSLHPEITHWVAVDDLDMREKITRPIELSIGYVESTWGLTNFVLMTKPYNEGIKQSGAKDKIISYLI